MSHRDVRTRPATPADADAVQALLLRLHGESLFSQTNVSLPKLESVITTFIKDDDKCCFVYPRSGPIHGLILGYASTFFFSDEIGAWDLAFYVVPERRGSRAAVALWREFEAWAQRKGARMTWLMTSTNIEPEKTGKLYRKLGLDRVGGVFVKRSADEP